MSAAASKTLHLFVLAALLVLSACGGTEQKPDGGFEDPEDAGSEPLDGGPDAGVEPPDAGTQPDGGSVVQLEIRRVSPPRGPLGGNTVVVLNGRGFVRGFAASGGRAASDQTEISFGGNVALDVNVIDDDTIEVVSPVGAAGTVDLKLVNPNGEFVCEGCFRYYEPIELTRVTPTSGSTQGGELVTLNGSGFTPDVLVLFGGDAATEVTVSQDGRTLTARTPPGIGGSTDVGVVGTNASAFLRRSYLYVAPMRVRSIEPSSASLAGGVEVLIRGEAFGADALVSFGGVPATGVVVLSSTEVKAVVPARASPGAVDVTVGGARGSGTLARGFSYFDASRDLQLFGLEPRQGPVSGGSCAQGPATCLLLTGSGFNAGELEVRVGSQNASYRIVSDNLVEVDLPAGQVGVVDVQARTLRGGAQLEEAFAYVVPLTLSSITPDTASGSGSPAVSATLTGTGLDESCVVYFGTVPGTTTNATGSTLAVTTPAGPAGVRDVRVECGEPGTLLFQEATLAGAFTFSAPLRVLQIEPESGAIAGNTAVSVYGAGFTPGMTVHFGAKAATSVEVKGPHLALVRTPRGEVGEVDVGVSRSLVDSDVLAKSFAYQDPTNIVGGASGGPMRGILNVTVLNSTPYMSGPVPGVRISVNSDQLVGVTDDRGQVTFSDSTLLKPVTITGTKEDFASSTIARVDARNVTLRMQMNEAPEGEPSEPPPPPGPAVFSGKVCGFKTPPGFVLAPSQRLEARVRMTASHVYSAPPFGWLSSPVVVTQNCGTYTIATRRWGAFALYAEFGIRDDSVSPAAFTPLIMGIRRGLEAAPDRETTGQDIILDMHRDLSIPVSIEPAAAPVGETVVNLVYSYLDLGGEGVVPLAESMSTENEFVFEHHPRVAGEGLLFLNMAALYDFQTGDSRPPYSFFYRRQYGDPAAGIVMGPMLAFTRMRNPASGGVFTGTLGWNFTEGRQPDVQQLTVNQPAGFMSKPIWSVVLPGTEQSVSLPPVAVEALDPGVLMNWTLMTARSPRFEYDRFGYQQLSVTSWTSFTQDYGYFVSP